MRVVELSIAEAKEPDLKANLTEAMADVSLCNTLGFALVVLLVNAVIAIWFGPSVAGGPQDPRKKAEN